MNELLFQPILFWISSFLATVGVAAGVPLVDAQRQGSESFEALVEVDDLPRSLAALRASRWSGLLPDSDAEIIAALLSMAAMTSDGTPLAQSEGQGGLRRVQWSRDEAGRRLAFTLNQGIDGTGLPQVDWFAGGHVLGDVSRPALNLEQKDAEPWDMQFALRVPRFQLPDVHLPAGGGLSWWALFAAYNQFGRIDGALAVASPETRIQIRSQLPQGWPLKPIAAPILADIPSRANALWVVGFDGDQWWQAAGAKFVTTVTATLAQRFPEAGDAQALVKRMDDEVRLAGLGDSLGELMQSLQFDLAVIFPAEASPLFPLPEIIVHGSPAANAMIARLVTQHLGANLDSGGHHQIPGLPFGSVYLANRAGAWMLTTDRQRMTSWLAGEEGGWAKQPEIAGWLDSVTTSGAWAMLHAEPQFVAEYCTPTLNHFAQMFPANQGGQVLAKMAVVLAAKDLGNSRMVLAPASEGAQWQLSGHGPLVETLLASLALGVFLSDEH